jgi:hypothetical protein
MRSVRRRPARLIASLTAVFVLASTAFALAQFRERGFGILGLGSGLAPQEFPDADFVICRLVYTEVRRYGQGWRTDYPLGERNLSVRFSELTKTRVSRARDNSPNHYLVRLTDDQLFSCPVLMAGDVGSMGISASDATRLREYLLKGGFLWTDDMWGTEEWDVWQRELAKVFPPKDYPVEEIGPSDPLFRAQFVVKEMPQIPNIGYWRRSGDTSEQGADSAVPKFHVVRDHHGRIMVAMTHNTDIADAFEREGDDPVFFSTFSPNGYALGINLLLHALTH